MIRFLAIALLASLALLGIRIATGGRGPAVPPEKTIQPNLTQDLLLQVIEQLSAVAGSVGILQGQINIVIAENERAAQKRQAM
jgi:hypothetical protein